jgi:branched-chain amino acid transport system ATP-binding protein
LLEVDGLVSFYGQFKVLHEVSLRVNNGEFIVVFGPNGHGKSTLLKTICGLHSPASGSIRFNGEEITKLPSSRLVNMGIVYIAEERHLFPEMTVLENLKLGASNTNAKPKEAENLEYCFELFPKLKLFSKRRASTLSGGELTYSTRLKRLTKVGSIYLWWSRTLPRFPNLPTEFTSLKTVE